MPRRALTLAWLAAGALLLGACAPADVSPAAGLPPSPWVSRAIPEARGDVKPSANGKAEAVRYRGWGSEDFGRFRTYAYGDPRPEVAIGRTAMPAIPGDPARGRTLFLSRSLGPCTG